MEELCAYFVGQGVLTPEELARVGELKGRLGHSLVHILPQLGMVTEQQMVDAIVHTANVPIAVNDIFPNEMLAIADLNLEWLQQKSVLPLAVHDDHVDVAMSDPMDEVALAGIKFACGRRVHQYVAKTSDIADRLNRFAASENAGDIGGGRHEELTSEEIERMIEGTSEAPVIRFVNSLLANAIRRGASDIHIEPMARHLAVRFRIDGRLVEVEKQSRSLGAPVASRIKVMASLDISESRMPQDGRIRFTHMGQDVDVRVSTSPIAGGESIVLRILGRGHVALDLDKIGLQPSVLFRLKHVLAQPNGIILITGPTGSGKTTTLYAALNLLRRPEVKILTVEDPVEILLDGVNQVQVQPEIGLDYGQILRAFLRQDPDVLMIGEIRDRETADIALRAALTGHLVLSSLHTNNALGAFTRLEDIGIDNYLTASTVTATIAQRLLRTLCVACKITRPASEEEVKLFQKNGQIAPATLHDVAGCPSCSETGYLGRAPIMEFVAMDDRLKLLVNEGRAEEYKIAPSDTLTGHALALVIEGRTSVAEALRVTGE